MLAGSLNLVIASINACPSDGYAAVTAHRADIRRHGIILGSMTTYSSLAASLKCRVSFAV
jgi:hypothetical protein